MGNKNKGANPKKENKAVSEKEVINVNKPTDKKPIKQEVVEPEKKVVSKETQKSQKKVEPKVTPKIEKTGKIETTPVEEVKTLQHTLLQPYTLKSASEFKFSDMTRMSADGQAHFLAAAERFYSRQDPAAAETVFANQLLNMNFSYNLVRVTVQNWQEGRESGLNLPTAQVDNAVTIFNSFGLALAPASVSEDGSQTRLEFKESASDKEVVEQIKEDNEIAKTIDSIELDPEKWKNNEDAVKGLTGQMSTPKTTPGENLVTMVNKAKAYFLRTADAEKTKQYADYTFGDWFSEALSIMGNKKIIFSRGLSSAVTSSMKVYHNVVFSHCMLKKTMESLNDEDIASLIKAFVVIKNKDTNVPLDQDLAILNAITSVTREQLLGYSSELTDDGKRVMAKLKQSYKDALGNPTADEYTRLATNEMIRITNLYLTKDANLQPYAEAEYPAAYTLISNELKKEEGIAVEETPNAEEVEKKEV